MKNTQKVESYSDNDALFWWEHEPHLIKIKYNKELKELTIKQEKMAIFLGRVIDTDYSKKEISIKIRKRTHENTLPKNANFLVEFQGRRGINLLQEHLRN